MNSLRRKVDDLFKRSIAKTAGITELEPLHHRLLLVLRSLDSPMRVALVGKIKAGKSTLMNAFLGEDRVPTGNTETTFNVNWFCYSDQPNTTVYFLDGRTREYDFSQLRDLTVRDANRGEFLRSIKHISVGYPNDLLKQFHLIDTPGLDSYYEADSKNTLQFLGIKSEEVEQWTISAAGDADAIVYLFSRTLTEYDISVMRRFHGGMRQMNAANAIGVLTKVDDYYPQEQDPMAKAMEIVHSSQQEHSILRQLFYTIQPICGLLALGAQTLTPDEFKILQQIAAFPGDVLEHSVWRKGQQAFSNRDFDNLPGFPSKTDRSQLVSRLGLYGIKFACENIRSGLDFSAVKEALFTASGVKQLRTVLSSHFGNRAFIIKLYNALDDLRGLCFLEYQRCNGRTQEVVEEIATEISEFIAKGHAFRELEVLRNYYEGILPFNENEVQWMLAVTGEWGTSIYQRLGMAEGTAIETLYKEAEYRMAHFQQKAYTSCLSSREARDASEILRDSFALILQQLQQLEDNLYSWQ
ncbi:MAG: dynamin family protein [Firmicutes bacterium]|nr:dynamin family protein [Bacillota bacterium]